MNAATALKITELGTKKLRIVTRQDCFKHWSSSLYAIGENGFDTKIISVEGYPFRNEAEAKEAMIIEIKQAKEFVWEYFCPN